MEIVDYLNGISPSSFTAGVAPVGDDLVSIAAATSSASMNDQLDAVTDRVRPITAREGDSAPYIVYTLGNARLLSVGAGQLGTILEYDVGLFHKSWSELSAMIDTTNSTLTTSSITSISTGIDTLTNNYLAALSVEVVEPAISGSYPLLLVSHTGESAGENIYDNRVGHQVRRDFSIAILSDSDNIETLRSELRGQLLGYQQTANHEAMMYSGGFPIDLGGGLYCWQENYYDTIHYRET